MSGWIWYWFHKTKVTTDGSVELRSTEKPQPIRWEQNYHGLKRNQTRSTTFNKTEKGTILICCSCINIWTTYHIILSLLQCRWRSICLPKHTLYAADGHRNPEGGKRETNELASLICNLTESSSFVAYDLLLKKTWHSTLWNRLCFLLLWLHSSNAGNTRKHTHWYSIKDALLRVKTQ